MTEMQMDLLFKAYILAKGGLGMVLEPEAYPVAHELAEQGWLERRFESDGEMSW